MKNVILQAKLVKSIEEGLDDNYDNKGIGFLLSDDVDISVGQILEDDGTVRDIRRDEVIQRYNITGIADLGGLLKVMTHEEKTSLYSLKTTDIEVEMFFDEISKSTVDIILNTILVDKGILTQDRLDEITGYKAAYDEIMAFSETTTTTTTNA